MKCIYCSQQELIELVGEMAQAIREQKELSKKEQRVIAKTLVDAIKIMNRRCEKCDGTI